MLLRLSVHPAARLAEAGHGQIAAIREEDIGKGPK
jgi:hypothetical protein